MCTRDKTQFVRWLRHGSAIFHSSSHAARHKGWQIQSHKFTKRFMMHELLTGDMA
jgi:hypothetical protein